MARQIQSRQMELQNVNAQRESLHNIRIGSLAGNHSLGGRRHAGNFYTATTWVRAMKHVEVILLRGNAASVVNAGGVFTIKETITK